MNKKEIIIDLADVDGFFNDFDATTIQLWKDQGLNIVENDDGLHVAVKFDVSDLDNIKPISQQDEAIVRSIENSFINFNTDEIKREAHDYHAFFKKDRSGSVCLNSFGRFVKWTSASLMPPPSLVSAR